MFSLFVFNFIFVVLFFLLHSASQWPVSLQWKHSSVLPLFEMNHCPLLCFRPSLSESVCSVGCFLHLLCGLVYSILGHALVYVFLPESFFLTLVLRTHYI